MANTIKRSKAVAVAKSLIDEGGMTQTYSDLEWMKDDELFNLLIQCGFYWDGREWLESN